MAEFTTPAFLENYSVDDVYETMSGILPADIDNSEGSHTWNLLRPTALIAAELCEFVLPQVIQLIFPEWSYGEFLDAHASARGMARKEATAATGDITITGVPGTVIPEGSTFSTPSQNNEDPSIGYLTMEQATIPEEGSVTVDVQCAETGTVGNTGAGTIILLSSSITGITGITNQAPTSGGTEAESDEDLIARIEEHDKTMGDGYVGNVSDYRRWATSVAGVGNAAVMPASDDSGLVTIVITDSNGDPASETLCTTVYNYIMSPGNPNSRLAPINASVSVIAPQAVAIGVKATVELEPEATTEAVSAAFFTNMTEYLPEALSDGEIKITRVAAVLSGTDGVDDFSGLEIGIKTGGTVSYGTSNIPIETTQLPTVASEDITVTAAAE